MKNSLILKVLIDLFTFLDRKGYAIVNNYLLIIKLNL